MSYGTVVLLDNDLDTLSVLQEAVEQRELNILRVEDHTQAIELLKEGVVAAILVSLRGCPDWRKILRNFRDLEGGIPCIALADRGDVAEAVETIREGAADYWTRPFILSRLRKISTQPGTGSSLDGKTESPYFQKTGRREGFANIIGESKKIRDLFSIMEKVADSDTTVHIHGESGTGKELVARALHFEGARGRGPFIPVNCGAIPGELLESELFGHEKGAFTHAIRTRIGRFELAHGGTVFLDEIAEMSPMLQVKLLRVLQERKFERIGGTKTITSDFRVIAATNRELEEEMRKGRFREDLYYRLNVIPIKVPPLRERVEDIPLLVSHFIDKFNKNKRKAIQTVEPEVLSALFRYPWPGNVRELENVVERMIILSSNNTLTIFDLPERFLASTPVRQLAITEIPAAGYSLNEEVASFEKRLLVQALNQTGWVKNRAAKLLNINRTTLLEKLKKYDLSQESLAYTLNHEPDPSRPIQERTPSNKMK